MSNFSADFNLSVTRALRDQLAESLNHLDSVPLDEISVERVQKKGGVYQLFEGDRLLYVGKSTRDLRGRLGQHRRKLSGRAGTIGERVSFKCVYIAEDLDALAPEKMLISQYRNEGLAAWNTNGFGNKDPGRNRDTSLVEAGHFDSEFPINLDLMVTLEPVDSGNLRDVMSTLKKRLPYNFRYQSDKSTLAILSAIDVSDALEAPLTQTVTAWIEWLVEHLPNDWAVVTLPGYLIAYRGFDPAACESRTGSWQASASGEVAFTAHNPAFGEGEVPIDEGVDLGE